jgi:uncharacterized protein (TIGR03086 family)
MRDEFHAAAAAARPVVRGITAEQFTAATPCREYSVAQLLNHLFQVVEQFTRAARGEDMEFGEEPDRLHGDWHADFDAALDRLVTAWSDPEAMTHDTSNMGIPRSMVAMMPVCDLVAHGWDLARATGRPFHCAPELAEQLYAVGAGMAPMARRNGVFGEEVEVPDDASYLDRFLGVCGRDPQWTP